MWAPIYWGSLGLVDVMKIVPFLYVRWQTETLLCWYGYSLLAFPPTQSLHLGYHTRDLVNLCQLRKHPPSQSGPGAGTLFYGLQAENGFYSFKMVKKENQRENNILWHMNIIWNSNSSVCKILMEQSHAYSFTCCLWLLLPRLQELQQRLYGLQSLKYLLSGLSQKVCLPLV